MRFEGLIGTAPIELEACVERRQQLGHELGVGVASRTYEGYNEAGKAYGAVSAPGALLTGAGGSSGAGSFSAAAEPIISQPAPGRACITSSRAAEKVVVWNIAAFLHLPTCRLLGASPTDRTTSSRLLGLLAATYIATVRK